MRLPRILNQCHPIPGFVYGRASFAEGAQTVLIPVRPRKRSTAICSGCHQPAPGYDQSPTPRRFEFIGFWGYLVFLVYCMRRVACKQCGVLVEEVPWGMGKHTSTLTVDRYSTAERERGGGRRVRAGTGGQSGTNDRTRTIRRMPVWGARAEFAAGRGARGKANGGQPGLRYRLLF